MKRLPLLLALCLLTACSKSEPETITEVVVPLHWMAVVIVYLVTSAITQFDSNTIRGIRLGDLPPTTPPLPNWIGFLYYLHWGLLIALAVFDWKFAILVFLFKTVLSFLGILPIIGGIVMIPFLRRGK